MTPSEEAKMKAKELVKEPRDDYEWGGSEDDEGTLQPGCPDWETLEENIAKALDEWAHRGGQ